MTKIISKKSTPNPRRPTGVPFTQSNGRNEES
jgi:hypothetical protein